MTLLALSQSQRDSLYLGISYLISFASVSGLISAATATGQIWVPAEVYCK